MIQKTRQIMGMPVTVIVNNDVDLTLVENVFRFFEYVDVTYSPFRNDSVVGAINRGDLLPAGYSDELKEILALADRTARQTGGYFALWHKGMFDPSGIVKGWAIQRAADMLACDIEDFYVEAGGDIQTSGNGPSGDGWRIGVRNPFQRSENIALVTLHNEAIATSGTAIRGSHIYNPLDAAPVEGLVSLSIIAPRIVDADRFATAAFAMSGKGIYFVEGLLGYEGLLVDYAEQATATTGWRNYDRSYV